MRICARKALRSGRLISDTKRIYSKGSRVTGHGRSRRRSCEKKGFTRIASQPHQAFLASTEVTLIEVDSSPEHCCQQGR